MNDANAPTAQRINDLASRKRRRIAVGLDPRKPVPEDIGKAQEACEVVCVGRRVEGCESVDSATPEKEVLDLLLDGKVDGVVRGQLDHTCFVKHLLDLQKLAWKDLHLVSLLRHGSNLFWLTPVSNTECWIKREKVFLVNKMLSLQRSMGVYARVALISSVRKEDLGPQWYFDGMYYDSEDIVREIAPTLETCEWIRHYSIETERALADGANVMVMPNGMVGNQCYRLLVYTDLMQCHVNLLLGAKLKLTFWR